MSMKSRYWVSISCSRRQTPPRVSCTRAAGDEPLADDEAFTQLLEEIGPSLDYDGLFEELLMSYPISLGYYFGFFRGWPGRRTSYPHYIF